MKRKILQLALIICLTGLLQAQEKSSTPAAAQADKDGPILAATRTPENIFDKIGTTRLYRVTGALGANVWGTDVYPDFSELAPTAVHAGVLKVGETAVLRLTVVKPLADHPASTRNGVTSQQWGAHDSACYRLERTNLPVPDPSATPKK